MVDIPAARGMLQKGLSIFENVGTVETKVGGQIKSIPKRTSVVVMSGHCISYRANLRSYHTLLSV
jgi:hypothetical protein